MQCSTSSSEPYDSLLHRNASLTTNVSYTGPATVVFQDRTVNVKNGVIQDIITGYGSAVYRFPPIKSRLISSAINLIHTLFSRYHCGGPTS